MSRIVLLDGSIGQELVRRVGTPPTPLWSAQVLADRPEMVEALHADYFAAGATIATTNTYNLLRDRLAETELETALDRLTETALTAAASARQAHGGGRIAGALGPLGASYRPDLAPPPDVAAEIYAERIAAMSGRVDLLLFETMSSVAMVEGALLAGAGQDLPVWVAVSTTDSDGTRLRSGEPVADLAPLIGRHRPAALLINCTRPEAVRDALAIVKEFGCPFGAYANGFTGISDAFLVPRSTVDALEARRDLGPAEYARFAMEWVGQGASIVGGCCEVGPGHIKEIARQLEAAGHEIVQP